MRYIKTFIGALLMLMGFYVIVTLIMIILGWTDTQFSEISFPLIVLLVAFSIKVYSINKNNQQSIKSKESETKLKYKFNPYKDKLEYSIYEQKSETWWSDSDGDSHTRPTIYSSLRFYENGTVIGIRDRGILKIENENSFVYKGIWNSSENTIQFNLDKIRDIDDSVNLNISDEEHRDMKYAGHIAIDSDLIMAGNYKGTIQGNQIIVNSFTFTKVDFSELIITASESVCDDLNHKFSSHDLVYDSYTNSGNWYSNGETGPEWYTITIKSRYEFKDQLENEINKYTSEYSNMFWG